MGTMRTQVHAGDIPTISRLIPKLGIFTNKHIEKGTIMLDVMQDVLVVHPHEEHVVWAELGFIDKAFDVLNESLERRIALAAAKATHNVYLREADGLAWYDVTV